MSRFTDFMPWLLEWEGGYDNDPDDPGGETKYGIDKRSHPKEDIKNLTVSRATVIYLHDYWTPLSCEELPLKVGEVVMNIGVNAGKARAGRWLQQTLNGLGADLKVDEDIGPKTVAAAKSISSPGVLAAMLLNRTEDHYRSIAHGRMAKFLKGWLNRNNSLRSYVAALK